MIVWISIGNSDNKLTQEQWSKFIQDIDTWTRYYSTRRHAGPVHSSPDSMYQNCHWCVELDGPQILKHKEALSGFAKWHKQESIAWNEVTITEFIKPLEY